MKILTRTGAILTIWLATHTAYAGRFPEFATDEAADQWLRASSLLYQTMAADADRHGGYGFKSTRDYPKGVVLWEDGKRFIALNDALVGANRASVIIFELTNCYHERRHLEVDEGARTGRVSDPGEFALWHEVIEQDGLALHRRVLVELDQRLDGLPREALQWIKPGANTLADYQLGPVYESLKAQVASGHLAHYRVWFWKQRGDEQKATEEAAKAPANREPQ